MKFFDFINERGGKVTVEKIDQPAVKWENPKAVFQNVLDLLRPGRIALDPLPELVLSLDDLFFVLGDHFRVHIDRHFFEVVVVFEAGLVGERHVAAGRE